MKMFCLFLSSTEDRSSKSRTTRKVNSLRSWRFFFVCVWGTPAWGGEGGGGERERERKSQERFQIDPFSMRTTVDGRRSQMYEFSNDNAPVWTRSD